MGVPERPFYHVCERCNAKFFSRKCFETCPRCSSVSRSRERLLPPWCVSAHKRGDETSAEHADGNKEESIETEETS